MKATVLKIYPSLEQKAKLERQLGCARFVYNHFLTLAKRHYLIFKDKEGYKRAGEYRLSRFLTRLKKTPKFSFLQEAAATCLCYKLKDLETAYLKFFKEKKGFPRYKKKYKNDTIRFKGEQQKHIKIVDSKIRIPKIGWVKFRGKLLTGTIVTATIRRYLFGRFEISLTYQTAEIKEQITPLKPLGIDINCHNIVLSTGEKIITPKYNFDGKIKYWQKILARRKKGSERRRKARAMLSKWHWHAKQKRQYFIKEIVFQIAEYCKNQECYVMFETINLPNLTRKGKKGFKRGLNRSLLDTSLGYFRELLAKKVTIKLADRFFASSKLCSNCGVKNEELTLKDRMWSCDNCGEKHDRDINAAKNLEKLGFCGPFVEA